MSDSELSDGMEDLKYISRSTKKENEEHDQKKQNISKDAVSMDKFIFGDKEELLRNLAAAVDDNSTKPSQDNVEDLFDGEEQIDSKNKKKSKRKPVWVDPDDEKIQLGNVKRLKNYKAPMDHLRKDKPYKEFLTNRFTRIVSQPKWASLDRKTEDADSDDDEMLRTVGHTKTRSRGSLNPDYIGCKYLKNLNRANTVEGIISSIQFHPTSRAALVAGYNGSSTIYAVDGIENEKLHSIFFDKYPIKRAQIKPCGTKALFTSNKHFYYSYDLLTAQESRRFMPQGVHKIKKFRISPCGRYLAVIGFMGAVHLFELESNELIHSFKQEHTASDLRFTADSSRIVCNSISSNISVFSLRQQRTEHVFVDDGCIRGSVMDLSPDQRLLATASQEGVVNVYNFDTVHATSAPTPLKRLFNLTTNISDIKFNHTSELLAMCSGLVPAAVKLCHFPSGTVYSNFPDPSRRIGAVRTIEFSPSSGYLALGCWDKKVPLIRFKYFKSY
ncbi:U3 small nucleolar RNA-associated protein 18 homolog [Teleopsis dalmanni]|uniref:U3 small nucleolar RNA-associated protein 18 homolog n=1 Tax=Teleopsis dalmanni TaxID=139649 RepID=UPI000D32BFF9|nr:U3 small nucleolar RNA-associated protein 18 homolog [Teleopsis dalmanni]XP_037948071.1 U3 small nucleolar RNA-associated protein 18 homolog [Teleopsis dalmanni]